MLERNAELLEKVAARIEESPQFWNQDLFVDRHNECGTTYCIGGWAIKLHDGDEGLKAGVDYPARAAELLGLTENEADVLFFGGFESPVGQAADGLRRLANGEPVRQAMGPGWDE